MRGGDEHLPKIELSAQGERAAGARSFHSASCTALPRVNSRAAMKSGCGSQPFQAPRDTHCSTPRNAGEIVREIQSAGPSDRDRERVVHRGTAGAGATTMLRASGPLIHALIECGARLPLLHFHYRIAWANRLQSIGGSDVAPGFGLQMRRAAWQISQSAD